MLGALVLVVLVLLVVGDDSRAERTRVLGRRGR
jgi:hypothetical protein